MRRANLTLVYDASSHHDVSQSRDQWGFENAKQLNLFDALERDFLIVVPMNNMDAFGFSRLIESERPASIIDTRKYPDFFGLYRSTRAALEYFERSRVEYVQAPVSWIAHSETKDAWTVRSTLINGLTRAKGVSDFHNRSYLLLISTAEMKESCAATFASLPDLEKHWQLCLAPTEDSVSHP